MLSYHWTELVLLFIHNHFDELYFVGFSGLTNIPKHKALHFLPLKAVVGIDKYSLAHVICVNDKSIYCNFIYFVAYILFKFIYRIILRVR